MDNIKNINIKTTQNILTEILEKLDRIDNRISRINREIINVKKKVDKIYDLKNTNIRW